MKTLHALGMFLLLSSTLTWANDGGSSAVLPRFSVFAGAGSGLLVSSEQSVPFRVSAGAEYFFRSFRHVSVGYMLALPVASDQIGPLGSSQTPHRMIHYFPRFRCFLFSRDFALGGLSVNFAPGVAVQHLGTMMGGSTANGGPFSSIAAQASLEYSLELEDRIQLGLEASSEYIAPVRGTTAIPRTLVWSAGANLHFFIGGSSNTF